MAINFEATDADFYRIALGWQKNATEWLLKHLKEVEELKQGQAFANPTMNLKKYDEATSNVICLEKALQLLQKGLCAPAEQQTKST